MSCIELYCEKDEAMNARRIMIHLWKKIKRFFVRMPREQKRLLIVGCITLLLGIFVGGKISGSIEEKRFHVRLDEITAQLKDEHKNDVEIVQEELDAVLKRQEQKEKGELPWNLRLVNRDHPLEESYKPELVWIEKDIGVDSRIADATNKMLADAKKEGMRIQVCSAYRSIERQKQIFNDSVKERLANGMGYWEAFADTRLSVAEPGTSEHALGLSLDLISFDYDKLDQGQENTKEAKWLKENCYKYGFILRYPPEKTEVTKTIYEPWHYRYVGVEEATKIMESGITLEEYIEDDYLK